MCLFNLYLQKHILAAKIFYKLSFYIDLFEKGATPSVGIFFSKNTICAGYDGM